ncbi:hypothetical protein K8F61_17130 [Microbacterium resistens]|uniref:Uncharacterized protein n=1 Tax=Microbacterium resistens TaxID=156977 RepID=A0ABY3RQG6_9MICO|nr:hypothetical protein [Microbacterium resistens]UGS26328.1 hypothetical protein K8F61_17130 [Microbacterium resistens]
MALKEYTVDIGGIEHTLQLDDKDAERMKRSHKVTEVKKKTAPKGQTKAAPKTADKAAPKPNDKAAPKPNDKAGPKPADKAAPAAETKTGDEPAEDATGTADGEETDW